MRTKLFVLFIAFILLSAYISVEDKTGDLFLENATCLNCPQNELPQPLNPFNEDVNKLLANTPLPFTENRGQLDNDEVRFYEQGGCVWFTDDGVWFKIKEKLSINNQQFTVHSQESRLPTEDWRQETSEYKRVILKQEFMGANQVRPEGRERLSWNSNFFYGNNSSKWCTEVPNYREIYYEELYYGIDLRYYTNGKSLKYDFIIHPGADATQIRLRYKGAEGLEIDKLGTLIIKTSVEDILDGELFIYQNYEGVRNRINGKFTKLDDLEYGFEILDDYDVSKVVVIDPALQYSTYIGGSSIDIGYGIAVDTAGNSYITGLTKSSNFPTTTGAYDTSFNWGSDDVFVVKLNYNGSQVIYSTFVGSGRFDQGYDIAVDSTGNAYVTGSTKSSGFPTTPGAYDTIGCSFWDVFVFKLNSTGSNLLYSTYVHGSAGEDIGQSIKVDSNGNAFVTGYTSSSDFPFTAGAYDTLHNGGNDIFVFKLNQTGQTLIYSTFIGAIGNDFGYDITIDSQGNAFVTGTTLSSTFPNTTEAYDI